MLEQLRIKVHICSFKRTTRALRKSALCVWLIKTSLMLQSEQGSQETLCRRVSAGCSLTWHSNLISWELWRKFVRGPKMQAGRYQKVTAGQRARRPGRVAADDLWKRTQRGNGMQVRRQRRSLGKEMRWLQRWNRLKWQEVKGGAHTINKLSQTPQRVSAF